MDVFYAANTGTKCAELRLYHLSALDTTRLGIRKYSCIATYSTSNGDRFTSKVTSGAPMRMQNDKPIIRKGTLIVC